MPPKAKFTADEIVRAAVDITRKKGFNAVTAREVGAVLGVSSRPLFTYFNSVEALKNEVVRFAKQLYRDYVGNGLKEDVPFLGVWRQYLQFASDEPELYRLLFLSHNEATAGGAAEALSFSQDLARDSIMRIYNMNELMADCYFRDVWLVAFSFATLIVTGNCPYTIDEMLDVGAEISLSVCKAYKEIPGLPEGTYNKDLIFRQLVNHSDQK